MSRTTLGVEIKGLGHFAPKRVVSSGEIERDLGLESGWIFRRTGIDNRRYADDDQALSDLAVNAGDMALRQSGLRNTDIGLVLLATSTPDHLLPPTAPLVAHRLGLTGAGGIDLAGACGGFLYAVSLADAFVRSNQVPVLVIAANILSRRINPSERASRVLFADAAGAVVLSPTTRKDAGLVATKLVSNGAHYGLIHIPAGGSRTPFNTAHDASETLMIISNGQKVYTEAVAMMTTSAHAALEASGIAASEIDVLVPHQANARMMASVAHALNLDAAKMASTISDFGNSSAATIPFTLSMHAGSKDVKPGTLTLLTAAGAGMTGGSLVWRW